MSDASRMATKAMSGSLALVSETSRSSPADPSEGGNVRGEGHHAGDRCASLEQVAAQGGLGHLRDHPVTETIRRKARGSRNTNSFRRIPGPTRRSIPPGPVSFFSVSMAIIYYRRYESVRGLLNGVIE